MNRDELPIIDHLPLITGHIMWISMVNERIILPMKYFLVRKIKL